LDADEKKVLSICGCICFAIILLVSIILIAVSFSVLETTEVGLDFNGINQSIDDKKLYEEGRHFLGLGHEFLRFPRTVQVVEVDNLNARTKDGLSIYLDTSLQWRFELSAATIAKVYKLFLDEYVLAYEKISKDIVRNAAAKFSAFEFFFSRGEIQSEMRLQLEQKLAPLGVQLSSFQLLNFDLPVEYTSAIQVTEEKRQRIEQVRELQQKAQIDANSRVAVASERADITRVQARAEVEAFLAAAQAQAASLNATLFAERNAYRRLSDNLNLTVSELLNTIWISVAQGTDAAQILNLPLPKEFLNQ